MLGETVVIGKAFGVNEVGAQADETFFKTLRLGDSTEGSDFAAFEKIQSTALGGKYVLQVERMMNTFDDGGGGIQFQNASAEFVGSPVAFRDENKVAVN